MKAYLTLIWYFICLTACATSTRPLHEWALGDTVCNDKKIQLVKYAKYLDDKVTESGIVVGNRTIECRVECVRGNYIFAFGKSEKTAPILFFSCATNQPSKTFNGRQNGKKVGIWFGWYLWGGVRRATMYLNGQRNTVVYFRPNGHLARVVNYKNGKRRHHGNDSYDKQGNIIGGRNRF